MDGQKKCKYCAMMISAEAKICPHCRKNQGVSTTNGCLIIFMAMIAIAVIIGMLVSGSDINSSPDDLPNLAYYRAQSYVKNILKAPATADFPPYTQESVKRVAGDERGEMYEVRSYVDSQNSFGAQIRTHYKCTLVRVHAQKTWILAELIKE